MTGESSQFGSGWDAREEYEYQQHRRREREKPVPTLEQRALSAEGRAAAAERRLNELEKQVSLHGVYEVVPFYDHDGTYRLRIILKSKPNLRFGFVLDIGSGEGIQSFLKGMYIQKLAAETISTRDVKIPGGGSEKRWLVHLNEADAKLLGVEGHLQVVFFQVHPGGIIYIVAPSLKKSIDDLYYNSDSLLMVVNR